MMIKKQFILALGLLIGITTFATAGFAQTSAKITNTRIVQATKDTTVTYAGVKVFVPQGSTVILGQDGNGAVVVRGKNVSGVKINNATVSFPGAAVLSVNPQSNVITVNRGDQVSVTDGNGRTAVLSQGASVSALDVRVSATSENSQATAKMQKAVAKEQKKIAKEEAKAAKADAKTQTSPSATQEATDTATELPAFVASTVVSSAASEQAAQNVEETEKTLSDAAAR